MADRFPEEKRNFETRLTFIHDIFESKYPEEVIMTSCIQYKLNNSYNEYLRELERSFWKLYNKDPMEVLKRIDINE